ncbi:hypothetical protein [Nocardia sp. NPDC020380]|uniref:hypothetical protein n=1 Tax=Nocardia sp. NPDC020380 TaxID=3364309 RepID=UPI0037A16CC5
MTHAVQSGVSGRNSGGQRAAGALLIAVAVLVLLGTVLIFGDLAARIWVVAAGLCIVVSGIAGVLLVAGKGSRSRIVPWLGTLSVGLVLGTTFPDQVDQIAGFATGGGYVRMRTDAGFWPYMLADLLAIAALVMLARGESGRVSHIGGGRAASRIAGAFLAPAGILIILAPLATVSQFGFPLGDWLQHLFDGRPFYLAGMVLILVGVATIGVAIALLAGLASRSRAVRITGSVTAAALFGIALADALTAIFWKIGYQVGEIGNIGKDGWMYAVAIPLSFAAVVASLVADLETPRAQAVQQPRHMAAAAQQPSHLAAQGVPFGTPQPLATQPPRMARVYDGRDENGRPTVSRPQLNPNIRAALLAYLESAPIVLAARSFDADEFVPGERDVPLNFRTDGVWVWAGAVPHYLIKHGVPPEPDLVRHIADRGYQMGLVDESARQAAVRVITSA